MLTNCSFILHTSNGQYSRLRILKNGIPQGSVLAPMLFYIYVNDLPPTLAKKYGYTDDIAIRLSDKCWETIEEGFTADMSTMSTYLKNCRLRLSVAKTMSSSFPQQLRGKARAQSHGGWQHAAVRGNTHIPWSEAQPGPDLPTTPGEAVSKYNILSLPDTPPR